MNNHCFFWRQHPALLAAITLLIGASSALFWPEPWLWVFPLLWCAYLVWLSKWSICLLLPAMIAYCHFLYDQTTPDGETEGIFSIATVERHQSPFTKGFVYKGILHTEKGGIPCDIYTQGLNPSHPADCDYFVSGKLDKRGPYQYICKPKVWSAIKKSRSFANWRYGAKERYRRFLKERCPDHPQAAEFLAALTTGDVDDRLLKYQFGRLGLQHILAISGFHFGVLIAFASFTLGLFLPRFWKLLFLIACLNGYYFFVGPFPAVQRSWLAAIAYLTGKLMKRQTTGLNLLGLTLGFEIILNPLIANHLGFQFSFASTAGILLLYQLVEKRLRLILPKRSEIMAFSFAERHAYLLAGFIRNALALTASVNAALLPLLLFHFHTFPLLSFLYNLFFPFCVGVALSGLLLALSLHLLVPSVASLLFFATSWFTSQLLDLAAYPPSALDYSLLVSKIPAWSLPFCLFSLLLISIKHEKQTTLSVN